MTKIFQKKVENFICENCGIRVSGTGYTNHCPACLWSKHVDINPGDRESSCNGLMEPVDAFYKQKEVVLVHQCVVCGHKKKNKLSQTDDITIAIGIMKNKSISL